MPRPEGRRQPWGWGGNLHGELGLGRHHLKDDADPDRQRQRRASAAAAPAVFLRRHRPMAASGAGCSTRPASSDSMTGDFGSPRAGSAPRAMLVATSHRFNALAAEARDGGIRTSGANGNGELGQATGRRDRRHARRRRSDWTASRQRTSSGGPLGPTAACGIGFHRPGSSASVSRTVTDGACTGRHRHLCDDDLHRLRCMGPE